MQTKRVLVTGAAGFIGHHLVHRLLREGHAVVGIDDFSTGRRDYLADAVGQGLELVECDVRDARALAHVVAAAAPGAVYHLAALHFIPACDADPERTRAINVEGTRHVLDALPETVRRFVLASTGAVYEAQLAPHAEDDPLATTGVYGLSKLQAESLVAEAAARRPGTRFRVARFFNVYGPRETNPHVIPDILRGVARGGTLRLGNLTPRRDYIYVDDIVDGLVRLLRYDGPESTFNFGSGVGLSVTDLVAAIGRVLGRDIPIEVDPARVRAVDRESLVADTSRCARELGWLERRRFEDGIRDTIEVEMGEVTEAT